MGKPIVDFTIIKAALEFARFEKPIVREHITKVINELDKDLKEVGYDMSLPAMTACEELETLISELEELDTKPKPEVIEDDITDDIIPISDGPEVVEDIVDDDDL